MFKISDICSLSPVIPVIEIDDAANAVPLVEALMAGGIRVVEITLRTSCALDAIHAIASKTRCRAGAGTLLSAEDVTKAKAAGAAFGVSPGTTPALLQEVRDKGFPFLPGGATPSEAMVLVDQGYEIQKFFPAEASGGTAMLKGMNGPLKDIRFCPTGGISPKNAKDYLSLPNVICVGGSWIAPRKLINERAWDQIEINAREAVKLQAQ